MGSGKFWIADLICNYPTEAARTTMSDKTNHNGSASVRDRFPQEVEALYRAAFRSALDWYGDESEASKVAWRAVGHAAASLNSDFERDCQFLMTSEYQASGMSSTTSLVN